MSRARTYQLALPVMAALLTWSALPGNARAQSGANPTPAATSQAIPSPEQLEPAVDTTRSAPAAPTTPPTPSSSSAAGGATASQAAAAQTAPAKPGSAKATRAGEPAAKSAPGSGSARKADRLQLDTTDITGNRELPKVLYIVPWKHSDLGDLTGKPVNSLIDEVLQPLDRDVFQRQNRYYNALKPGQPGAAAADAAPDSGRKP